MHSILQIAFLTATALFLNTSTSNIMLRGNFHATSELVDGKDCFESDEPYAINVKYGIQNLFDENYKTAWVEGANGQGIGEAVYLSIPYNNKIINIFGGFGKSNLLYKSNSRPKRLKLTCYAGINPEGRVTEIAEEYLSKKFLKEYFIDLQDKFAVQSFPFPFSGKELKEFQDKYVDDFKKTSSTPIASIKTILKIEIADVYKGMKYKDTCISEIFFNTFICDTSSAKFPAYNIIYVEDNDNGKVKIDIPGEKGIIVLQDNDSIFQIASISKDKKWSSIIKMPAKNAGRVETEYLLLNIKTGRIVNSEIEKIAGIRLFDFSLNGNNTSTTLKYLDGEIKLTEEVH